MTFDLVWSRVGPAGHGATHWCPRVIKGPFSSAMPCVVSESGSVRPLPWRGGLEGCRVVSVGTMSAEQPGVIMVVCIKELRTQMGLDVVFNSST